MFSFLMGPRYVVVRRDEREKFPVLQAATGAHARSPVGLSESVGALSGGIVEVRKISRGHGGIGGGEGVERERETGFAGYGGHDGTEIWRGRIITSRNRPVILHVLIESNS